MASTDSVQWQILSVAARESKILGGCLKISTIINDWRANMEEPAAGLKYQQLL